VGVRGRERELCLALREGDALGFELGGVRVATVAPGEAAAALRALRADGSIGVLAVEAGLLEEPGAEAAVRAHDGALPVVVAFALPRRWPEAGRGRELVAAIVRRAVGYHVKLGGTS
jgi:vacuolar-type H+-ATPase subunit F/Vma7